MFNTCTVTCGTGLQDGFDGPRPFNHRCDRRHVCARFAGHATRRGKPARANRGIGAQDGLIAAGLRAIVPSRTTILAGACRNRTYQPPCDGLSDFEDRANHQIRTLPRWRKALFHKRFQSAMHRENELSGALLVTFKVTSAYATTARAPAKTDSKARSSLVAASALFRQLVAHPRLSKRVECAAFLSRIRSLERTPNSAISQ